MMIWWLVICCLIVFRGYIYREDRQRFGQLAALKRLQSSILIMITLYLGFLGLLLGFENRMVYHPSSAAEYWSPPPGLKYEDVTFQNKMGDAIHAWWCPDPQAKWTVLFSHGNAGNLSGHAWIISAIRATAPCNIFIYDYPGYGKSTGKPGEAGCYSAADAAYQWLRDTKKTSPEKLILMGQSLGCAMACHLAVNHEHCATILLSPFTSIRDVGQELMPIFPVRWLMSHRYDNRSKLVNYKKPLLIGHSTSDEVIPFHHGKDLFDAAGTSDKTLHTIQGEGHNSHPPSFFQAMKAFLLSLESKTAKE